MIAALIAANPIAAIIILVVVILGSCVFAACATAPHCEPAELHEANESERAALRREAEEASRAYHVCDECHAERDRAECQRCGDMLASRYSRRSAR